MLLLHHPAMALWLKEEAAALRQGLAARVALQQAVLEPQQ